MQGKSFGKRSEIETSLVMNVACLLHGTVCFIGRFSVGPQ